MALLWADGFDDYSYDAAAPTGAVLGEYETFVDNGNASTDLKVVAEGRRGSGAAKFTGTAGNVTSYFQKTLPAAKTELFIAFALNPAALSATIGTICSFFSATAAQITLLVTSAGAIQVLRGAGNGVLLGTSASGVIPASTFTHVQVRVVISATAGVVQVRLNGATTNALDLTGVNTSTASAVSVDAVRFGYSGAGGGAAQLNLVIDDYVIWDTTGDVMNTWAGDVRVDSFAPIAEGDTQNFTPSSGSVHYSLVNKASPVATSYVQSSTVDDKELYRFAPMLHSPSRIYAVMPTVAALKDDAGGRSIRLLANSGGTEAAGPSDVALSTARARYGTVFETDPKTGARWSKSGYADAQFGVKVTV